MAEGDRELLQRTGVVGHSHAEVLDQIELQQLNLANADTSVILYATTLSLCIITHIMLKHLDRDDVVGGQLSPALDAFNRLHQANAGLKKLFRHQCPAACSMQHGHSRISSTRFMETHRQGE